MYEKSEQKVEETGLRNWSIDSAVYIYYLLSVTLGFENVIRKTDITQHCHT